MKGKLHPSSTVVRFRCQSYLAAVRKGFRKWGCAKVMLTSLPDGVKILQGNNEAASSAGA